MPKQCKKDSQIGGLKRSTIGRSNWCDIKLCGRGESNANPQGRNHKV